MPNYFGGHGRATPYKVRGFSSQIGSIFFSFARTEFACLKSLGPAPLNGYSSPMKAPRRARRARSVSHRESQSGSTTGGREQVLALFVNDWAIEMLQALDRGPKLYPQIEREFTAASHAALAETLRNLQDVGLVWRKAYPNDPAARGIFSHLPG
jgi:DNA-binding HxlR family transcriptional regulator